MEDSDEFRNYMVVHRNCAPIVIVWHRMRESCYQEHLLLPERVSVNCREEDPSSRAAGEMGCKQAEIVVRWNRTL